MKSTNPILRGAIALLAFVAGISIAPAAGINAGDTLPPWVEGFLDIHHINTGRGESSLIIMPDGTTMLVDAGDVVTRGPNYISTLPDESREPAEWIARYITRATAGLTGGKVNYLLLTHFHSDHMGRPIGSSKTAAGGYKLAGITHVAEHLAFEKLMDRGWPDYNFPAPMKSAMMDNYRKFVKWQAGNKALVVERFKAGVKDQIVLRNNPAKYPHFEIRNLAVNGIVWTGLDSSTRNHFPDPGDVPENSIIENNCSIAFRLSYGAFDYYSGGDLSVSGIETAGSNELWKDIERPVALITGPVDVMKANHHAYYDANSAFFLGMLRPRVIVSHAWFDAHPSLKTYRAMRSEKTWPGKRDIFITNQPEAARHVVRFPKDFPPPGHIVIRVSPGGAEYYVYVLEETNESGRVKSVHGPYASR